MNYEILDADFQRFDYSKKLSSQEIAKINFIKIDLDDEIKRVKKGRIAMIVWIVLIFLSLLDRAYYVSEGYSIFYLIQPIILLAVYFVCILKVPQNAKLSFSIILGVLLLEIIIYRFVYMMGILTIDFFMEFLFLYFIVRALISASNLSKMSKELLNLGVPDHEIALIKALKKVPKTPQNKVITE